MKIEVFKTNVPDPKHAKWLAAQIEGTFRKCAVNFDLGDCDRILRVASQDEFDSELLIELLRSEGIKAEALPDTIKIETTT